MKLTRRQLFRELDVFFTNPSLKRLENILQFPHIAHLVRVLKYEPCFLWTISLSEWEVFPGRPQLASEADIKLAYNQYLQYRRIQDDLVIANTASLTIRRTLPFLRNLVSIEFINGADSDLAGEYLRCFGPDLICEMPDPHVGYRTILNALHEDDMPAIHRLSLEKARWKTFAHIYMGPDRCIPIFSRLIELSLDLGWLDQDYPICRLRSSTLQYQRNLGACLATAQQLETLNLEFRACRTGLDNEGQATPVFWESLCPGTVWPKLKKLALKNVHFSTEHAEDFFSQHKKTLKEVTLNQMSLIEQCRMWNEVFKSMRQHLTLDSLVLKCVWEGAPSQRRGKYLDMVDIGEQLANEITRMNQPRKNTPKSVFDRHHGDCLAATRIALQPRERELMAASGGDLIDHHVAKHLALQPQHRH